MKALFRVSGITQMCLRAGFGRALAAGLIALAIGVAAPVAAQETSNQSRLMAYSERLDEFERLVRELTGRVETLEHQLRQANRRIEQLEAEQGQARDSSDTVGTSGVGEREETLEDFDETAGRESEQSDPRDLGTLPDDTEEGSSEESSGAPAGGDGNLPEGSATEQYNYAFGLLQEAEWEQAEAALAAFVEEHPDDSLAGNAKYWLGETYYVRQDYIEAAQTFAEGYKDYPDSNKASDNLLKLGMSLAALEQVEDACGTFEELEARYSDAPSQILERSRAERERLGC